MPPIQIFDGPDPNVWYQLFSNSTGSNTKNTLLDVIDANNGGDLQMTAMTNSSTKWQIIAFNNYSYIRNQDLGPLFQLGTALSQSYQYYIPYLKVANSSAPDQQWTWNFDGSYYGFENAGMGIMGYLSVSISNLPFMDPGTRDVWTLQSVGDINDASYSTPVTQASPASASTTFVSSGSSRTLTSIRTSSTTIPSTSSGSASQTPSIPNSISNSHSIPTGATAGIAAVGAIIGIMFLVIAGFFIVRCFTKRQEKKTLQSHTEQLPWQKAEAPGDEQFPAELGAAENEGQFIVRTELPHEGNAQIVEVSGDHTIGASELAAA